ncbi:SGNH hydrolase-type esterase domain-containing protein [Aspergillus cavernicola]|uniref:SGNH hydrolase-type esterase domain-containing protein n=1 Tax=Aspergillus cavernicola TaxID=176166 RepID=A0ABR4IK90_9EURO
MRSFVFIAAVTVVSLADSIVADEHEGGDFWLIAQDWINLIDGGQGFPLEFIQITYDTPSCDAGGPSLPLIDDLSGDQSAARCNGCGAGMGGSVDVTQLEWKTEIGDWGHHTFYKNRDNLFVGTDDEIKGYCIQDTSHLYTCSPPPYTMKYWQNSQLHCWWLEPADPTIPQPDPSSFKAMFVGDSITQGREGDFTWRFRLWQWLVDEGMDVDFVGPHHGTKPPEDVDDAKPSPPSLSPESSDPTTIYNGGKYAKQVSADFPDKHYAQWGRQAVQVEIDHQVATYTPHWLLVMVGFNDLGWWVSGPEGTLETVKNIVADARRTTPGVKILVGNVVQRTLLVGVNDDLPEKTTKYNKLLKDAIGDWSSSQSPVKLVDVAANYDCAPGGCPAGYDGLHPNADGELQIAQAFSRVLHEEFDIGSGPITNANGQKPTAPPVEGFTVKAVPEGVKASWEPVFGARGYDIRAQRGLNGEWADYSSWGYPAWWETWVLDGEDWSFRVRTSMGDGDDNKSAWSHILTVVAHPETVGGPANIQTKSTGTGMRVSWSKVEVGDFDRYAVIIYDPETDAYPQTFGTREEELIIEDLHEGHTYNVAVQTWTEVGGGFPAGGPAVTI